MNFSHRNDRSNPSGPAQSRHRAVRFSKTDRVIYIPSRKDLTQKEIRSSWVSRKDIATREHVIADAEIEMRRLLRRPSSFGNDGSHTSFRGLEHLLRPCGTMKQKRDRHLLVGFVVQHQVRDATGRHVVNGDELALMSQMLSKDAADRARARGIDYERAENENASVNIEATVRNMFKNLEEESLPPRQHMNTQPSPCPSSSSCPNQTHAPTKTHLRQARKPHRHSIPPSPFSW